MGYNQEAGLKLHLRVRFEKCLKVFGRARAES